jgi:hypothetical protein
MAQEFAVFVDGLTDLDIFDGLDKKIARAASRAINTTTRDSRVDAARKIRSEINFPARFVSPSGKGLYVSQKASPTNLEGRITARGRPTSLSRFLTSSPRIGRAGVTVEVAPGKARFLKRVFALKLPQGSASVENKFNLGLAIRLRPGERISNKTSARRVSKGLYLLYGPSVDQVFRANDGDGVAKDMVPAVERNLEREFLRLLEL